MEGYPREVFSFPQFNQVVCHGLVALRAAVERVWYGFVHFFRFMWSNIINPQWEQNKFSNFIIGAIGEKTFGHCPIGRKMRHAGSRVVKAQMWEKYKARKKGFFCSYFGYRQASCFAPGGGLFYFIEREKFPPPQPIWEEYPPKKPLK